MDCKHELLEGERARWRDFRDLSAGSARLNGARRRRPVRFGYFTTLIEDSQRTVSCGGGRSPLVTGGQSEGRQGGERHNPQQDSEDRVALHSGAQDHGRDPESDSPEVKNRHRTRDEAHDQVTDAPTRDMGVTLDNEPDGIIAMESPTAIGAPTTSTSAIRRRRLLPRRFIVRTYPSTTAARDRPMDRRPSCTLVAALPLGAPGRGEQAARLRSLGRSPGWRTHPR